MLQEMTTNFLDEKNLAKFFYEFLQPFIAGLPTESLIYSEEHRKIFVQQIEREAKEITVTMITMYDRCAEQQTDGGIITIEGFTASPSPS